MTELVRPVGIDDRMLREMYKAAIRRYYKSHRIPIFFSLDRKEFGVGDFGRKIVRRYVTFTTSSEFKQYLINEAPLYVSYSVASWEYPDQRDDAQRNFISAELVFEFDDDEFVTSSPTDISYCLTCHDITTVQDLTSKGLNPLYCIKCGSRRQIIPLPSEYRWNRVVDETRRLITVLMEDFGIPKQHIHLNYSGNRGIHIHITDPRFTNAKKIFEKPPVGLSRMKEFHRIREELTKYLTLSDFDAHHIGLRIEESRIVGPTAETPGMVGRIVRRIVEKLETSHDSRIFYKYSTNFALRKELENVLSAVGNYEMARRIRSGIYDGGVGNQKLLAAWIDVFNGVAKEVAHPIDAQTSADIKRLIRMPNTIHGTTGLAAAYIPLDKLNNFNPYKDAVALPKRPTITLWIKYLPEVRFDGRTFGPYNEEEVELPLNFAFFLLGVFGYWNTQQEDTTQKEEVQENAV